MSCMNNANRNQNHNGFTVEITDETYLGLAMLIAESEDGQYEPVAVVSTVGEAREIVTTNLQNRMQRLNEGDSPLCPQVYKVWASGRGGGCRIACEIEAAI